MQKYARVVLCLVFSALTLVAIPRLASAAGSVQQESVLGVRCADVDVLGIRQQENFRAGLIRAGCGLEALDPEIAESLQGGSMDSWADNYGGVDVDVITGGETYPKVTQSESMVWSTPDGSTIVVNYNDSNTAPSNYSGVSVSFDSGASFTRLLPAPFATGHGTNYGDPIVVWNDALQTWFAGDLATGCGGQGIALWTSADAFGWSPGACAHSGGSDDRESMWVDNNASSPYYGRMYVSWNDFAAGQRIYVVYSDDGSTWTTPIQVTTGFIRNIQLTGSPTDGTVFIAGMDEHGGGGTATRTNLIYVSSDGGNTWQSYRMGPDFAGPGGTGCGYFWRVAPIWRHMGWGQPAAGPNGVVHYAYAGRGVNAGDLGDIYYVQSQDNGQTWSDPIVLNTDQAAGGTREQWMPSVSVTSDGNVFVAWYDRRNTTDGTAYEYWGVQSTDNGATWQADMAVSDVISPQPLQPDSSVQSCYVGDYNYHSTAGANHWITWADGRVLVSGHPQQNVFFDQLQ